MSCQQGEGKVGGRRKREFVLMAEDFNFQMPVIYVIFKLTIQVRQAQQQQLILNQLHIYKVGLTQLFTKLENLSIHQMFN